MPTPGTGATLAAPAAATLEPRCDGTWAEQEFGRVDFPDARLRPRRLSLAPAFAAQPTAPVPVALQGDGSRRSGQGGWAPDARDALAALQSMLMVPDLVDADGVARLLDEDARYFVALDAWDVARALTVSSPCGAAEPRDSPRVDWPTSIALVQPPEDASQPHRYRVNHRRIIV